MNQTEEIRHKWETFNQTWSVMWRAFGKDAPTGAYRDDVWEQCQYIPANAWDYIKERIRDMDTPPRNWAKKLKALHYQWHETNLPQASRKEQSGDCDGPIGRRINQLCRRGMPALQAMRQAVEEAGGAAGVPRMHTRCPNRPPNAV